ncbi:hypothetical protein HOL63_02775 [Candidatus Peregrinibacteria bacterium]|jgi:hypothetical protein|nr:hypothetical protein [Candidatus Peregrinibacteria bacterium]MBT5468172.1 hypothetical protein [Candidatus Peregrinibacteria bacterium]MBT7337937.1 hypothetical protein [Candidatus Peregrinibacteria bacterium]
MAYQNLEPVSKQLTIVIGLTVVGFMAFGFALSFYRNLLFEQTLGEIGMQNNVLRERIAEGHRSLEYFQSSQYKDKYSKENLNLVRPGEKILVITHTAKDPFILSEDNVAELEQQEAKYFELMRQMPVLEHWKLYLFHKDKIEELKMNL